MSDGWKALEKAVFSFQLLNIFLIVYFDLEKTKMVTIVFR